MFAMGVFAENQPGLHGQAHEKGGDFRKDFCQPNGDCQRTRVKKEDKVIGQQNPRRQQEILKQCFPGVLLVLKDQVNGKRPGTGKPC